MTLTRRDLLVRAGGIVAASTRLTSKPSQVHAEAEQAANSGASATRGQDVSIVGACTSNRPFNGAYRQECLNQIAFPLGGMGAGMFCLTGTGALTKFSLRNRPELNNEPLVFAAVAIKEPRQTARVLEGQIPGWKLGLGLDAPSAAGLWGVPRFRDAEFEARFPFASVRLKDDTMPLQAVVTGWSPFVPGDEDSASLPVGAVEYRFVNSGSFPVEAVFSFNAENFLAEPRDFSNTDAKPADRIQATKGGFVLYGPGSGMNPWKEGCCAIWVSDPNTCVNYNWFDASENTKEMLWNILSAGGAEVRDPLLNDAALGASIFVPFKLAAGQQKTVGVRFAWYVPRSNVFAPDWTIKSGKYTVLKARDQTYQPWYSARFSGIDEVKAYWDSHYDSLRQSSKLFSRTFYDSTLPAEIIEAVAANLAILKSPCVLRQPDGRLWAWEGTGDDAGLGYGSCTHVWNYAQVLPHLFPRLERSLRETEFGPDQGRDGFQAHRAALPIRPIGDTEEGRNLPAAADGQLGGIIKIFREWRISGDTSWLRGLWSKVRASLDYCIRTWDPKRRGWIEEAHLNTYDVEFWGPDSLCATLYVGALKAACVMGAALSDDVHAYAELLDKGVTRLEEELFNGEFFVQKIDWRNLQIPYPRKNDPWDAIAIPSQSPDTMDLVRKEGPPFQVGPGCLADGVLGAWLAYVAGLDDVLDRRKVESHLTAVHRHNFKNTLIDHAVVQAPWATGIEGGLLLCTWPNRGRPSISLPMADSVLTGIEYQVASHLIALGKIAEGLEIVRTVRLRYDGRTRNPFSEIEYGHWYTRAMSSYALLQALSGARFDAVDEVLYLRPTIKGDFRCFLSTATGYGTVGVRGEKPFVEVAAGEIPCRRIDYTPVDSR